MILRLGYCIPGGMKGINENAKRRRRLRRRELVQCGLHVLFDRREGVKGEGTRHVCLYAQGEEHRALDGKLFGFLRSVRGTISR